MKRMGNLAACVMLAGVLAACGGGDDGGSTLNVSATGSATQGTSVGAGGSTTLSVQSSDFIRLQTSQPVRWQAVITSDKTTVTNQVLTETQWSGNLVSPTGDSINLTATQVSDPSKVFTLKIAVAPQRYNAGPYTVGQVATFAETQVRFNGTSTVENLAYTVAAVNNGLATITSANADTSAPDTSYVQDLDRNRLSRTYTNGNVCTYSPKRALYDMPLYVGKSWTGSWNYACQMGYTEKGAVVGNVQAYESVTTPAGTFNALRIAFTVTYTNSNDIQLPNGNTGNATYKETILGWWAPELGRIVKWQSNYSYAAGFSNPTYMTTYTQVLTNLR
ncbi:hypothetical protein LMG19282_02565 [Cupriavidus campinensis]|uniref:Lipoprotein n=1 Tax=Cupriavidus campinensis TaxID=151783 RepID=A0AAE9I7U6_9BURK|nr:hypothetical protein [Cupriavidus campinensis]TSP14271.1 hypothetical protein FGG12_01000 [Cupriavidus campinensis]URF05691.1 hypothetical protein M5D45_07815 [Cupriavidus campinensis]CAG2144350.1 hypothetical protein LMG19282_02565 [Cupriavidus campinensis]